jgi:spore coat protein CotH
MRSAARTIGSVLLLLLACARAGAQTTADFFDDRRVHDIQLWIHERDWQQLRETYRENTYYPADVHWNEMRIRGVGIRSRGNGSRHDRKPGLRVDVDRYLTEQRFLGLKSFILDNGAQDASIMRERLAMSLFRRLGLPAPREAHARVFVNGEYLGLYVIVESIDKDFIERVYRPRVSDTTDTERDGYLFEYRWHYPFYFGDLGPDLGAYAELFEPRTHEREGADQLYGPIRDLARDIRMAPDADFEAAVARRIDLDQFVRYVAVENFLADFDGMLGAWGMNNFYLYRTEANGIAQVIAWDRDNAFSASDYPIWRNVEENVLMRRAMAVPRLRELYLATLEACAGLAAEPTDAGPGWLAREVEVVAGQIREAVAADRARPHDMEAFDREVAHLRQFADWRPPYVLCEVSRERGSGPDRCEARR